MSKFLPVLTVILFFTVVFLALIYFFQTDRLANPLKDVEPKNVVLSTVIGTINNLLGDVPESHLDNEDQSLEEKFAASGYPNELFSFDVTQQPAVFAIVSIDASRGTMVLRYIFPFDRRNKVVEATIDCPLAESKIADYDPNTRETSVTAANRPLYLVANADKDSIQGICADTICSSLISNCELSVTEGEP